MRKEHGLQALLARLNETSDVRTASVLVDYVASVPDVPLELRDETEKALAALWAQGDYEMKARILKAGAAHGFIGLKGLAVAALSEEAPDFVRLWAVRYLKRVTPDGEWRQEVAPGRPEHREARRPAEAQGW